MKIKYLFMSVLFLAITACDTDTEEPNSSDFEFTQVYSGDADFSRYVAMGGGVTAGMTDNSLFMAGQMGSYPNIMASVMSQTDTGGEFTQPYVDDNVGGINVGGNQFWGPRFFFDGAGPAQVPGTPSTEATNVVPGPYSNLAFPFANAIVNVAPGAGSLEGLAVGLANPWYVRAASSNDATILGDALMQQPTFVTLVPGNDFASYTLFGASDFPLGPLELEGPTGMLAGVVGTIQALSASVPNGVITTLPDPTVTATFTTIPWNAIPLDAATAGLLNAQLAGPYNGGLAAAQAFGLISAEEVALRTLNAVEGDNGALIEDSDLTDLSALGLPSFRLTNENDRISLFASQNLGTVPDPSNPLGIIGVTIPLPDVVILTATEIDEIQTKLATANAAISASVPSGWALFDLHGLYNEVVTTGLQVDGYTMTGDLVFGGFFSLDGFHPTTRGSAAIAKRMMAAIDATWGSNLLDSGLEIGDYPTNYPASM
jgi:hypothetical protein